jgi:hypothetical protein
VTGVPVTNEDVMAVLLPFKPGSSHQAVKLYERYERLMQEADRPVGTRTMFSRALTRYGCTRRVVRRAHGKRGQQVRVDTPMFRLPGGGQVDEIAALVREIGPGLHPLDRIYWQYLRMPHVDPPLSRPRLMAELGRRGHTEIRDVRKDRRGPAPLCRYFPPVKD